MGLCLISFFTMAKSIWVLHFHYILSFSKAVVPSLMLVAPFLSSYRSGVRNSQSMVTFDIKGIC